MEKYHLIGIGGIGMSALAKILLQRGCHVCGSDLGKTALTAQLKELGATIYDYHDGSVIDPSQIIVYSSGISKNNPELQQGELLGNKILHRAAMLDELMKEKKPLLVAGAHGKTSTTAMLAHLIEYADLDPSWVVGGISTTYQTNAKEGKGEYFIAEADESDGSFLVSQGFGGIVTNVEPDHLDFWNHFQNLCKGYQSFISRIISKKHLFLCGEDPFLQSLALRDLYYGFSSQSALWIKEYQLDEHGSFFKLHLDEKEYGPFFLPLAGRHFLLNATAAIGLALRIGVKEEKIQNALMGFKGVKRRLEKIYESPSLTIFDDYAHHPTEIKATLRAVFDNLAKGRRVCAIFQPHRYSRLHHFFEGFAGAFDLADRVVITDVYGAGELPLPDVSSELLAKKIGPKALFIKKESLIHQLKSYLEAQDVVVMMGAGDISSLAKLFAQGLDER